MLVCKIENLSSFKQNSKIINSALSSQARKKKKNKKQIMNKLSYIVQMSRANWRQEKFN